MKASYTWVVPSLKTYKRNIYQRKEINYLSMITENLSTLKIHKLTKAQYDRELESGNLDANALYLTPEESITKEQLGLGNVENKSSATIRGELTKENVTAALGYTPPTTDNSIIREFDSELIRVKEYTTLGKESKFYIVTLECAGYEYTQVVDYKSIQRNGGSGGFAISVWNPIDEEWVHDLLNVVRNATTGVMTFSIQTGVIVHICGYY